MLLLSICFFSLIFGNVVQNGVKGAAGAVSKNVAPKPRKKIISNQDVVNKVSALQKSINLLSKKIAQQEKLAVEVKQSVAEIKDGISNFNEAELVAILQNMEKSLGSLQKTTNDFINSFDNSIGAIKKRVDSLGEVVKDAFAQSVPDETVTEDPTTEMTREEEVEFLN